MSARRHERLSPDEYFDYTGVYERVIDFGPGYRIYFGKDGDRVVILLAGGAKKRQDIDISNAKERWQDYKQRKKSEK